MPVFPDQTEQRAFADSELKLAPSDSHYTEDAQSLLDDAIASHRQALQSSRLNSDADLPSHLVALAQAIRGRYRRYWGPEDITAVTALYREACTILSRRHAYDRLGHLAKPLAATMDDFEAGAPCSLHTCSIELPQALNDLYQHTGRTDDIEEQAQLCRIVLADLDNSSPLWARTMSTLGTALRVRHERFGNIKDLEEAVAVHQDVLEYHPKDHPDRHITLYELGVSLYRRFEKQGNIEDLNSAIDLQQEALKLRKVATQIVT